MQVKFTTQNRDVMLFKFHYCDVGFKTVQMVNFAATRTRNRKFTLLKFLCHSCVRKSLEI